MRALCFLLLTTFHVHAFTLGKPGMLVWGESLGLFVGLLAWDTT